MTRGHCGAGLVSYGKSSFFPSASELWTLPRSTDLQAAHDWTCELFGSYGLDTPPFPSNPTAFTVGSGEWVLKEYPSGYLSLESRLRLTADMVAATGATVLTETEVVKAEFASDADVFQLVLSDSKGQESQVLARRLILTSGRFGPLGLRALTDRRSFRRLEVGFRNEQPADTDLWPLFDGFGLCRGNAHGSGATASSPLADAATPARGTWTWRR